MRAVYVRAVFLVAGLVLLVFAAEHAQLTPQSAYAAAVSVKH
jgi:hypothetical protein